MRLLRPALALALLTAPQLARAGAFYIGDIGTRGMARGGAFVAAPDSLLAIHYNPAGLSLLSGLHFESSVSLVSLDFQFQRACPCADPTLPNAAQIDAELTRQFGDTPAQSSTPLYIPFIGVGYGLPQLGLTVALGAWGPHSGNYEFGELPAATAPSFKQAAQAAPARYTATSVDTLEANFALAAALEPVENLRLGLTLFNYVSGNDQLLNLWVNSATFATQPENADFDVPVRLKFRRNFAFNWAVGASYEALPGLSIGASFRGKRSIRSDGTVDIELPAVLTAFGASVQGNEMEIELNTAPITRLGVQYVLPGVFRAEVAGVYEKWTSYDRVVIRPKNIVFTLRDTTQPLARIVVPRGWNNTFSLRLGGELNLFEPWLSVQAGYYFEPTAIPPERLDASRVDLDKHGFGLGLASTYAGFTLQLGASLVVMPSVEVTNSLVKQAAPLDPPLGASTYVTTIGNGTYDASYFIVSASLAFALDPLLAH